MWNIAFEQLEAALLIFVRMSGLLLFNPLLMRRNVPAMTKMAMVLGLTFILYPTVDGASLAGLSEIALIFAMFKELMVGLICGYVFQIYYYLLFFAGDMMDLQFGLSMARVFDPGANIQASVSGNLLTYLFILYIFVTDSHLLMIKIFTYSYEMIPLGVPGMSLQITSFIFDLFISAFSLAIRLTLPFIAAEFVLEVAMGVLMKLIPQIHVFVINIQLKLLLGLAMLLLFAHPIGEFMDTYMAEMFTNMENVLYLLSGR